MKSIFLFCLVASCYQLTLAETDTPIEPIESIERTVIFIQKNTTFGQEVFLRGGIDHARGEDCTSDADTSACAIPIKHRIGGTNAKFNDWKVGDDFLDWYGEEADQGTHEGIAASGTPMVWTTNDKDYTANVTYNGYGYTHLNVWGGHYWMVDLDMDCSKTDSGWFELKGLLQHHGDTWEWNRDQHETCEGTAGGSKPYSSGNHFARCGYLNKFTFNGNDCHIDKLE